MMPLKQRLTWLLIAVLAAPAIAAASDSDQLDRIFERSTLQIATPDARVHRFRIWLADNDARRARGLMFVRHLEDDQGMLFVYGSERTISMWMKNTYVPLDMLFFDASGKIVQVVQNTEPLSLKTIESTQPAYAVLELKGGTAGRLKIAPGARVILQ
jgi:uncharacterized membrane protein (UPF0127 family)